MSQTQSDAALVLIEYQNDFLTEGGDLHGAIQGFLEEHPVLERTNELIERARRAGVPIVFVRMEFAPGHRELGGVEAGILSLVRKTGAFELGSSGVDFAAGIDVREGDVIVGGKRTICAFESTNLGSVLAGLGARRVYLAGQLTNLCIESTMRTAYDRGLEVFTVVDAMAATSKDLHELAVREVFPHFSTPIRVAEFDPAAVEAGA